MTTCAQRTPLAPHLRAALASGSPPQLRDKQLGVLLELKRQDKARSKGSFDGVIHSWETAFYSNLVEKRDYDVDQQKLNIVKPEETKKAKKDPNAPKRGLSAFMFFSNAKRDEVLYCHLSEPNDAS